MPNKKNKYLSKKKTLKDTKKSIKMNKKKKINKKKSLSGGLMNTQISNYDDNMMNRKFNCRQPFWEASCI